MDPGRTREGANQNIAKNRQQEDTKAGNAGQNNLTSIITKITVPLEQNQLKLLKKGGGSGFDEQLTTAINWGHW